MYGSNQTTRKPQVLVHARPLNDPNDPKDPRAAGRERLLEAQGRRRRPRLRPEVLQPRLRPARRVSSRARAEPRRWQTSHGAPRSCLFAFLAGNYPFLISVILREVLLIAVTYCWSLLPLLVFVGFFRDGFFPCSWHPPPWFVGFQGSCMETQGHGCVRFFGGPRK